AEMIAMQMTEHDRVDGTGVDAACAQRHQRRGTEIDEHGPAAGPDHEAGVETAAGAERVAAADDGQPHRLQAFALGRAATWACQRRTLTSSSGTARWAGFMKSTATRPVMSATVK